MKRASSAFLLPRRRTKQASTRAVAAPSAPAGVTAVPAIAPPRVIDPLDAAPVLHVPTSGVELSQVLDEHSPGVWTYHYYHDPVTSEIKEVPRDACIPLPLGGFQVPMYYPDARLGMVQYRWRYVPTRPSSAPSSPSDLPSSRSELDSPVSNALNVVIPPVVPLVDYDSDV